MTTPRTHRLIAFTMSLCTTLIIFTSVTTFATPEHAGQLLARATAVQSAHG